MDARKNIPSSQSSATYPKFRNELYEQSRLKSLAENLRHLDNLFHSNTPDGQHLHKELNQNELELARKLKDQIRLQLTELMAEGVPKEKLQRIVMGCCAPTIEFLSKE